MTENDIAVVAEKTKIDLPAARLHTFERQMADHYAVAYALAAYFPIPGKHAPAVDFIFRSRMMAHM